MGLDDDPPPEILTSRFNSLQFDSPARLRPWERCPSRSRRCGLDVSSVRKQPRQPGAVSPSTTLAAAAHPPAAHLEVRELRRSAQCSALGGCCII